MSEEQIRANQEFTGRLAQLEMIERNKRDQEAWGRACSAIMALPGLRAFWPMSSVDYATASQARDVAGGGYHLTNNAAATFGYSGIIPLVTFNGTTQYLSRADGGVANWADIIGTEAYIIAAQRGLTLGGWFKASSLAQTAALIGKYDVPGNQRSYLIQQLNTDNINFAISNDGIANVNITSSNTITTDWYFACGVYVPSTSITIQINTTQTVLAAGIYANLFDGASAFVIGARTGGSYFLGLTSMCFLCATALSSTLVSAVFQQTRAMFGV